MSASLADKKCIPCEGGEPALEKDEIDKYLSQISREWKVVKNQKITRDFEFSDFSAAIDFVNKVAKIAQQQDHHPDILVHNYKKVKIELFTHAIRGLHGNDFILAAKIEKLV